MKKLTASKSLLLLAGSLLLFSNTTFACVGIQNNTNNGIDVRFSPDDIGDFPVAANSCIASGDATQIEEVIESQTNQKINVLPNTTVVYDGKWSGFVVGCCPESLKDKNSLQARKPVYMQ